ncbi:DUF885 domain-containing protein [Lacimicrobium alkaliphilum]|uniref:DUF885 domain-containing protein n=1 Tax=Lacimicrobium alkaliphilum TaxID=1526571 RepID=A0ABQ1RQQ9_9ALTE|nr:DUF885 domain-containing protein [Lacimicrobium alkaliphilum]GGD74980.1 hypothetical protein GCM10011357_32460 [Lacimicrobium alkaliphilum]
MYSKSLISCVIAMSLAGCQPDSTTQTQSSQAQEPAAQQTQQQNVRAEIDRYTQQFLALQPALATMLDIPEELAGGPYNHRLPDYSAKGMQAVQQLMAEALASLEKADNQQLDEDTRRHVNIVKVILAYYAGDKDYSAGYIDTWAGHLPYIINQISGPLIDIPKLMQVQQPVTNAAQAEAYLQRLEALEQMTNQVVAKFQQDQQQGVRLPANLIPGTLDYFERFVAPQPSEHSLVTSFAKRLENVESLADQRQALADKAAQLIATKIYPAYQRAQQVVADSVEQAPEGDGIWAQPGGEGFYQHALTYLGDTQMSAEQVHQTGLDEVDRISTEMDTILKANGYEEGTVGERMVALASEPQFLFGDSDEGRQALLDSLNVEIDAIMEMAPSLFATMPSQSVEVRRIPKVSEKGEAGGFYTPPSMDGKRPGIYWINLRDMSAVPSFGLKTLTYHEAVPGHHFQIALNMAQQDIGLMRQNAPFNAFVEGWALYSELVAEEMGMYQDDPFGDLGRLQAELYRAVRLVVDTGLHAKKWTREQAIEYFHTATGTSMTDVVAEVERYMAWPGQALGYKLGMLKLVELRDMARQQLGEDFDLKFFHDLILLPGARPMSIVEQDVKNWIAEKQK